MKIVNKKKFIVRIIEIILIIATIVLTILTVKYANQIRGYQALGGEYLILPLGLIIVMVIETIYEESEEEKEHGKHRK